MFRAIRSMIAAFRGQSAELEAIRAQRIAMESELAALKEANAATLKEQEETMLTMLNGLLKQVESKRVKMDQQQLKEQVDAAMMKLQPEMDEAMRKKTMEMTDKLMAKVMDPSAADVAEAWNPRDTSQER